MEIGKRPRGKRSDAGLASPHRGHRQPQKNKTGATFADGDGCSVQLLAGTGLRHILGRSGSICARRCTKDLGKQSVLIRKSALST